MKQVESPGIAAILSQLRRELKLRDVRIPELAAQLDVAEPTLWRWLRGQGLSLEALDRICLTLGLDIRDLISGSAEKGADQFTLAQERVLAADRGLALLFFLILNGAQRQQCAEELGLDEEALTPAFQRLHRLGLVDIASGGRLRPLMSRAVRWRSGGPLDQAFDQIVKPLFLERPLRDGDALYVSDMVRLTEAGRARVHALFEALRADIYLIARQDRDGGHAPPGTEHEQDRAAWSALFMMVRPLDMAKVRDGLP